MLWHQVRADDDITVEIVRRLFAVLGLPIAGARPLPEPSPDVEVTLLDGRTIVVEQTTFHVDEAASSKGSAIRGEDTRTVKANPGVWPSGGWAPLAFIEPFEFRVREKAKKSKGYAGSRNRNFCNMKINAQREETYNPLPRRPAWRIIPLDVVPFLRR